MLVFAHELHRHVLRRCSSGGDYGYACDLASALYLFDEADGDLWCKPHTEAFGGGLFELRLKGVEGIARVFYCTMLDQKIVMLHCFVKKSQKTPLHERRIAEKRMKEIKQ